MLYRTIEFAVSVNHYVLLLHSLRMDAATPHYWTWLLLLLLLLLRISINVTTYVYYKYIVKYYLFRFQDPATATSTSFRTCGKSAGTRTRPCSRALGEITNDEENRDDFLTYLIWPCDLHLRFLTSGRQIFLSLD